ncbi:carboxypeptidase-like regulatory domain-containing protein [Actinoplanes sp. NEAU-A12]|uniref:Carboxypeptidase-like regulatory domain-containing protein n=1 Tax=Actinoplanes sandaracinus TaxID=3045177 RepID=A0ABT6WTJ3_9ACTN|nr:carboxypeptidase-like regulatory domain-containing protein [Actinoplanes sandaracinus]MDI6103059.1 carboxypeptidase-like regulatory domain-containing protein [Actinoplanes sandaracinus]
MLRSFPSRLGLAILSGAMATGALTAPAAAVEDSALAGARTDPSGLPVVSADEALPQATTLVVKAVDSITGAPVGAFCVQAWELDEPVCGDTDGVTLTGLPVGPARFNVEATDSEFYLAQRGATATLSADQATTVTVPLVFGGKVAITASDRVTGQATGGACFTLKAIGRPENFSGGCTGADGEGTLDTPVAAGTYTVFVKAPDSYGHQWLGRTGGTGDQKQAARVVVKPGKTTKAPAVRLDRAGSITGVVTGTDGTPRSGVNVNYRANANVASGEPGGVHTDDSGRYVIDELGPYAWPLLFSPSGEYPYQWSGNVGNRFQAVKIPVTAGGGSTYDITLAKGSTLRGTITPGSPEVRLLAHNAATGDLVGVFHGWDGQNDVTSYQIPLIGGQRVKLQWSLYQRANTGAWHAGATDISTATKVGIPVSGVKELNLTPN